MYLAKLNSIVNICHHHVLHAQYRRLFQVGIFWNTSNLGSQNEKVASQKVNEWVVIFKSLLTQFFAKYNNNALDSIKKKNRN